MYISTAEEIAGIPASWPGADLSVGSTGSKVAQLQRQLNVISKGYPLIPKVAEDGIYGEHTADAFGALAKEYSSDSNASDGGLYTRVYKGEMVDSFEDWCFDPSRKSGDTGIVETTYGYHVMYFQGTDIPYWQVRCINNLYTEWQNNIFDSAKVSKNSFGIKAVG